MMLMAIQCDVCRKEEALLFCWADEAALCDTCDRGVHTANKLAGKHPRSSLLHPTLSTEVLPCDVCRVKRALVFCQEDRTVLCEVCDRNIHSVNELTKKHRRFLLTGVKFSPESHAIVSGSSSKDKNEGVHEERERGKGIAGTGSTSSGDTSTISEYLMNTLPGWRLDELLPDFSSDG